MRLNIFPKTSATLVIFTKKSTQIQFHLQEMSISTFVFVRALFNQFYA